MTKIEAAMECEDCGEEQRRRIRCPHCKMLVCTWCNHHIHGCMPDHKPSECWDRHPELTRNHSNSGANDE